MSQIAILKKDQTSEYNRIDAEFYQPKYLQLEKNMSKKKCARLSSLVVDIKSGPFGSNLLCKTYIPNGVPIIRPFNLQEMRIDGEIVYVSKEDVDQKGLKLYNNEDVLFSRVGDVKAGLLYGMGQVTISPNIIAVRTNKQKLNPYYLITFLNTKYGLAQIERGLKVVAQPTIETRTVKNMLIPKVDNNFQLGVEKIVKKAFEFYDNSKFLYSQAENFLMEKLGLKKLKLKQELTYKVNFIRTILAQRIDAEYFQPSYDKLEEYLTSKFSAQPIGKFNFIEVTTGQYCEKYVTNQNGKPYIRGTDIENGTIKIKDLVYISAKNQIKNKIAKEGDVVVTRVGTIGLSARIPKKCDGGTISDNLIRLRFKNTKQLNPYYVALYLGSSIGISLMVRNSRGSVQQRLNQETLKYLVIPDLSAKIQNEIASFIQKSHEAQERSKNLLEEAIEKVEKNIEN